MARYKADSPLHEEILRILIGSAVLVEIVLSTNEIWDPRELEELINEGKNGYTNQYRKMLFGTVPGEEMCLQIAGVLGRGEILGWRNHSFWQIFCLAFDKPIEHKTIMNFFWRAAEHGTFVTNRIFQEEVNNRWWEHPEVIVNVGYEHYFMQFAVYSAWARYSREKDMFQPWYQWALATRQLFAKAVCATPHLFIRWPLLALQYKKAFWDTPISLHNKKQWFVLNWDGLLDEIESEEASARTRGIKLPPKSFFRKYNQRHLKSVYEHDFF